ncbi:VgrG-related protein [Catenulispora yoronensis]|uniref:VgrG-related protein n=1 Tax=Catenulispora yoronensis TaxID=450799 RepID=A0ABP5F477_9ACTN
MTTRAFANAPVVATNNQPLPAVWQDWLVETHVDAEEGRPAVAELRFRDPGHRMLAGTRTGIGAPLRIWAATTAEPGKVQIFSGEVTRVACEYDNDDGTFTVVRAQDLGHRLTRGRRLDVWEGLTLREVVTKVARHGKLTVDQVHQGDTVYRRLVQPNITDWEFLRTLAGLHGAALTVQDERLSLREAAPAGRAPSPGQDSDRNPYVLRYGDNLLALDTSVEDLGPVRTVQVRGWNSEAKQALVEPTGLTDSPQVAVGVKVADLARAWKGDVVTEVAGTGFALQEHLAPAARAFAEAAAADFAQLEATASGSPYLTVGAPVTLDGVGSPFTGRYTVTGVHHHFAEDGYRTTVSVATGRGEPGAAVAQPSAYAMPGLAVALVVDVKEPEGRQSGAVKLRFPWLDDKYTSDWARTVQWGGVDGGGVISPSTGDEVLVGFEQGRLDRPYVLGGLYNGKDKPTANETALVSDDGKVNRRSLASRGGDRIELRDEKESAGVVLATGNGGITVELARNGNKLTLTADEITLSAKTIKLDATSEVSITGKQSVAISSLKVDVKRGGA